MLWIIVFIISMVALVKGADWFLENAEKIGLAAGLSPFIIGVTIIGLGTSLPELASSIAAVIRGVTEIVPANAIGSNITNIFLVIGVAAIVGRRLSVKRSLIDVEIPLLTLSTVLTFGVLWDRKVTFFEALLLVIAYIIYLLYVFYYKDESEASEVALEQVERPKLVAKNSVFLLIGASFLIVGAHFLIHSVVKLSEVFNISPALISITAVAFGTSLPELVVSVKAARAGKTEIALGNIFGSNTFNALAVIGIPGLFTNLHLDEKTFTIGMPAFALATFLFAFSGISRRIYLWEGAMYLVIYVFFIVKLFNLA